TPALRAAIAAKTGRAYPGWTVDPETDICVTCGATEALVAVTFALLDPGDEIVLFEPWYENYGPGAQAGAAARAGLDLRRGRAARGVRPAHPGGVPVPPEQPDRQGLHRAGAGAHRRAVRPVGCGASRRLDLRAHPPARAGRVRAAGAGPRPGGPDD